jgi:hypothetical protein
MQCIFDLGSVRLARLKEKRRSAHLAALQVLLLSSAIYVLSRHSNFEVMRSELVYDIHYI